MGAVLLVSYEVTLVSKYLWLVAFQFTTSIQLVYWNLRYTVQCFKKYSFVVAKFMLLLSYISVALRKTKQKQTKNEQYSFLQFAF